jgi:hypothetical protein
MADRGVNPILQVYPAILHQPQGSVPETGSPAATHLQVHLDATSSPQPQLWGVEIDQCIETATAEEFRATTILSGVGSRFEAGRLRRW